MKLKLRTCIAVASTLLIAPLVEATPNFAPFLSVDINGFNFSSGQIQGPTEFSFTGWDLAAGSTPFPTMDWSGSGATGLTRDFTTSMGNITVNIKGVVPNSIRGAHNSFVYEGSLPYLYGDFVFAQRGLDGYGQHFIQLTLSGLIPGQEYEFTSFARDRANLGAGENNPAASFQAWTDRAALGGLDGPGAWMDANFSPGGLYQPAIGGVNNPIPTLARSPTTGPDSIDPYAYAASFRTVADGNGDIALYGWADPNGNIGTQTASLLNGFQIARVPDPSVAYEGFEYSPVGTDLLGLSGGNGFTGPWGTASEFANYKVGADSLSYSGLTTAGNRVTALATNSGIASIRRNLSTPFGEPSTIQYLSFLIRPEGVLNEGLFSGFFGLVLDGSTGLFVGKPGGGTLDQFVLETIGGVLQHSSGTTIEIGEEFLMVLRAEFTNDVDRFTLYINPAPGTDEPTNGTIKEDIDVGMINSLTLYSTGAFSIDEIRLGKTYADVVPFSNSSSGDYNSDGIVNAADYVRWRDQSGLQSGYNTWRANFGQSLGGGSQTNSSVPEPPGIVLFLAALLPLLKRAS